MQLAPPADLAPLSLQIAALAVQAGTAIMRIYQGEFEVTVKADASPLTAADLASHRLIRDGLTKLADYPLLSEEGRQMPYPERQDWSCFWLVDPLDGTKEFVKRNGEFTVNIALIANQAPILGVVYAPALGQLFLGARSLGAWRLLGRDGQPPVVPKTWEEWQQAATRLPDPALAGQPDTLRVVASRSHRDPATDALIADAARPYRQLELLAVGSSLKLCRVAEGAADLYPRLAPTMEWDTAAAHAVVEAAGGHCLQYDTSHPLRYNKENLLNPFFVVHSPARPSTTLPT